MDRTPRTVNLVHTATTVTDTDTAEAAAVSDPIDEQRRRAPMGGHRAVDYSVAINQVCAVYNRVGDLDHGNRIVGLSRFIDG